MPMNMRTALRVCYGVGAVAMTLALVGVKPAVSQHSGIPVQGIPHDWSHHHLVFSQPRDPFVALKLQAEPRYGQQWFYRNIRRQRPAQIATDAAVPAVRIPPDQESGSPGEFPSISLDEGKARGNKRELHSDWSMFAGAPVATMPGVYPAKYVFGKATASCTGDYVVFPNGVSGSATVPSIIAYRNLYGTASTGCGGTVPTVFWSVNLNSGTVATSPVLSLDGTQVAFVASIGGAAWLVVLDMPATNSSAVVSIALSSGAVNSITNCTSGGTAPCAWFAQFNGAPADTGSSPFYDYANNLLYVGDDSGNLHKFQNVFHAFGVSGTPIINTVAPNELTGGTNTSGWPTSMDTQPLTSPVFDSVSGNVFVGSRTGNGRVSRVPAATGGGFNVVKTGSLASKKSTGIDDAPLVDSSASMLYAFVNSDENGKSNAGVYQLSTTFASGDTGAEATLGQGNDAGFAYDGDFDNTYYTSANAASPTGHLYACGRASGSQTPTIYQITITANVMNTTAVAGPALSNGVPDCSPVTEISNGADHIFVSVANAGVTIPPISCHNAKLGCVMAFDVGAGLGIWNASKTTSATIPVVGGTGGIVIDNSFSGTPAGGVSAAGTMQVYYQEQGGALCAGNGTVGAGTGACQIQASQALLQ